MKIYRSRKGKEIIFGLLIIPTLFWLSCTQQTPMDPTSSVGGQAALLTDLAAQPSQISMGGARATISVRVLDDQGQALANRTVYFATSLGTITSQAKTNATGWAQATLISGNAAGYATVTVQHSTASKTVTVKFVSSAEALLQIQATKTILLADGISQTDITVSVLTDTGTGKKGVAVNLGASLGDITSGVITDNTGKGYATYTSTATQTDTVVNITAIYDTMSVGLSINLKGVTLSVEANPSAILPDAISFSTISALVKETTTNIPISNAVITFGTNMGTVEGEATTSAQGIAKARLTSSKTSGTAMVTAFYGNRLSQSVQVVFMEATASSYQFKEVTKDRTGILANGVDAVAVRVQVIDSDGDKVAGDSIRFVPTRGFVDSQWSVTDESGWASTNLYAYASQYDSTSVLTISRKDGSPSVNVSIDFVGVTLSLTASPSSVIADGESTSQIKAHLVRTTNRVPVSNAAITFGTSLGTIVGETTTNGSGVATVDLTSAQQTGTATVTATYGANMTSSTQVGFIESIPTYIDITISPSILPADGVSLANISAIVTDASSNPVPNGTSVQFVKISGDGRLESQKTTTNGVATTTITSATTPGTARIIARAGTLTSDTVTVTYTLGDPASVVLTSSMSEIPADGVTKSVIRAVVTDGSNNPVEGAVVQFNASIGDIVSSARTNASGIAQVNYSSTVIGVATITASIVVGQSSIGSGTTLNIVPGVPYSITVSYDPAYLYVKDAGKNQTLSITANVRDEKGNPVADSTIVRFRIYASPGNGDALSSPDASSVLGYTLPIPTVNGKSVVSYKSGTRSGSVRIQADVFNDNSQVIATGISTEFVIFAGPPYIADVDDSTTSHLTVVSKRLNIWAGVDTTEVTVLVGDKYNNPVQEGTAVYLTTSGGVVTTTAYTNEDGIAKAILYSGNPLPTINRFYNGEGMQNPNNGNLIGDPVNNRLLTNFEGGVSGYVLNSYGNYWENDGISRIIAHSEGVDDNNQPAKAWNWSAVVFSQAIPGSRTNANRNGACFSITNDVASIDPGEYATFTIQIWDMNGNPIVGGSTIKATFAPSEVKAELSWSERVTGDPGTTTYDLRLYNVINPTKEDDKGGNVNVVIEVLSDNGDAAITSDAIFLNKP